MSKDFPTVCPGHSKGVWELNWATTAEGQFFISACHDNLPMLRDGVTGDWIGTFEGHTGAVWSAKLNSSATRAATGSADSSAKVWNSVTGDLMSTFVHKKPVRTVDFRPDSLCLATGGYEAVVRLYDLCRPDADPTCLSATGYTSRIKKLVWAPDGRTLYMGSDDGMLRVWDVASGAIVREIGGLTAHDPNKCGVMDMELSRDNSTLTIAVGQSVAFVNQLTHEVMQSFDLGRDIETASLHPVHKRTFLAGGCDVYVRLYDIDSGAELAEKRGHHGKVHCLRFAPGGATYGSGADDATIRLWRYEEPQRGAAGSGNGAGASALKLVGSAPQAQQQQAQQQQMQMQQMQMQQQQQMQQQMQQQQMHQQMQQSYQPQWQSQPQQAWSGGQAAWQQGSGLGGGGSSGGGGGESMQMQSLSLSSPRLLR